MIQQTSLISYLEVKRDEIHLSESYRAILSVLSKEALTDYELSRKLGYADPNKVRPRRNELVKHGYIVSIGNRGCFVTGKQAKIWKAVSYGVHGTL